jgi:hypothetical protein
MIASVTTGIWGGRPGHYDLGSMRGVGMVPAIDVSNWNSPYDNYVFDWPLISGGWERMKEAGLAGLGEGPVVCDFTAGDLVLQIQGALGVPPTGVFDEATCAAWRDEYGTPPTIEALQAALPVPCDSLTAPVCAAPKRLSTGAIVGLGFFAVVLGLSLYGRMQR